MDISELFNCLLSENDGLIKSRLICTEDNTDYVSVGTALHVEECITYKVEHTNTNVRFIYCRSEESALSPADKNNMPTVSEFAKEYIVPQLTVITDYKVDVIMFALAAWYDVKSVTIDYNIDTRTTKFDIGTD